MVLLHDFFVRKLLHIPVEPHHRLVAGGEGRSEEFILNIFRSSLFIYGSSEGGSSGVQT